MKRLRRFLTLHARLLFAWSKPARIHVKRSVAQQFAVRKPKLTMPKAHKYAGDIDVVEKIMSDISER